jgi:hypothetical protein
MNDTISSSRESFQELSQWLPKMVKTVVTQKLWYSILEQNVQIKKMPYKLTTRMATSPFKTLSEQDLWSFKSLMKISNHTPGG